MPTLWKRYMRVIHDKYGREIKVSGAFVLLERR